METCRLELLLDPLLRVEQNCSAIERLETELVRCWEVSGTWKGKDQREVEPAGYNDKEVFFLDSLDEEDQFYFFYGKD